MQNRNSRRVRKREGKREEIFEGIGLRISCQINVQHQTTEPGNSENTEQDIWGKKEENKYKQKNLNHI